MKLAIRGIAALALVLLAAATLALASAGGATGATANNHVELAAGLVNLSGKFATLAALIAAWVCVQRSQWRWLIALGVAVGVTLFAGPLTSLAVFFFITPLIAAGVAAAYTFHMASWPGLRAG